MTKQASTVGMAVIGAGSIAELAHFPSINEIPEARLVAAADPVEEYRDRAVQNRHTETTRR